MLPDMESPGRYAQRTGAGTVDNEDPTASLVANHEIDGKAYALLWLQDRIHARPGLMGLIAEAAGLGGAH